MLFFFIKSLHIIFVVTWFSGLFYIVRLFIYQTEAQKKSEIEKKILTDQFQIMQKRLWFGITWPSAIITFILGPWLSYFFWPLHQHPWLIAKFLLVIVLAIYHFSCHNIFEQMRQGIYKYSSQQLRIWNEIATILLFLIIFVVIFKSLFSIFYGLTLLFVLAFIFGIAIKIYQHTRQD